MSPASTTATLQPTVQWGDCLECGTSTITDLRQHAACSACGKRYARRTNSGSWPACPACSGEVREARRSGACVGCGIRRDGRQAPVLAAQRVSAAGEWAAPAAVGEVARPTFPNAWKWTAGALGGLVLLVLGVAASQDSGTPARTATSNPAPAARATYVAPVPAVAPVQSGSGWTVLVRDMEAIGTALENVSDAALRGDYAGVTIACREVQSAVRAAQSHMPSPDATMDRYLGRALDLYLDAADACIRGVATMDGAEIRRATALMELGTEQIRLATARVQELQRQ